MPTGRSTKLWALLAGALIVMQSIAIGILLWTGQATTEDALALQQHNQQLQADLAAEKARTQQLQGLLEMMVGGAEIPDEPPSREDSAD